MSDMVDTQELIAAINAARIPHQQVADAIGVTRTVATKLLRGTRQPKVHEIPALEELYARQLKINQNTSATSLAQDDYLTIERLSPNVGRGVANVLEEPTTRIVPKALIENFLRGQADDFVILSPRGDSMTPDFVQGDEVIIDKRERDPHVPGAYALRAGGHYHIRNVEFTREGMRIFSTNAKYAEEYFDPDEVEIIGRPVWVGRLL